MLGQGVTVMPVLDRSNEIAVLGVVSLHATVQQCLYCYTAMRVMEV